MALKKMFLAGLICILLAPAGRLTAGAVNWDFSKPGAVQGWTFWNVATNSVSNGIWTIQAAGGRPVLLSPEIKIDAANQQAITFRMKLAKGLVSGGVLLFVSDAAPTWDDKTVVGFTTFTDGEWHDYEVDMSKSLYWKGAVKQLRFQPLNIADSALTKENAIIQLQYFRAPDFRQPAAAGNASGSELIQNNDFENLDSSGNPNSWKRFIEDHLAIDNDDLKKYGKPSNSIVSHDARSGKNAVLIDIPEGAKEIGGWSTRVAMKPRTTYILTFQAKMQGKPSAGVKVEEYGADGARKSCLYLSDAYSGDWKEYRMEFESKPETVGALVTAFTWQSCGKFWVDDVSLKEFKFTVGQTDETELKKAETPYLHLTREVVTPHIPWAVPWSEGPVRVLAIPPHREVVELAQRLDIVFSTWQKNIDGQAYGAMDVLDRLYYNPPERGLVYFAQSFFQKISQPIDVILVGKYDLSTLPDALKTALRKKIEDGAGLIVVRPKNIDWLAPALQNLLPLPEFVLAGVPFDGLPALGGESKGDKWLKCYSYGKGRIAIVNYYNEDLKWFACEKDYFSGLHIPFTPETSCDPESRPLYYDYYQGWLAKLVLWAGQKEGRLSITGFSVGDGQVRLTLASREAVKNASVDVAVRDLDGAVEAKETQPLQITNGVTAFTQSLPTLKSGRHFADVWIRDTQNQVLNWGSVAFAVTSPVSITAVKTSKFSYPPAEKVAGSITTDHPLSPDRGVRLQLRDSLGRLLEEQEVKGAGQKEIAFSFPLTGAVAIVHEIVADLLDGGSRLISHGTTEFVVRKEFNTSDDYMFYTWGNEGYNSIDNYMLKDMYERGFDSAYLCRVMYDIPADQYKAMLLACARQNMMPMKMVTGLMHDTDSTANPNLTIRIRELEGKTFRDGLSNELVKKSTVGRDFPVPAYSLGDEIGVSVYGQDYDFSPSGLVFIRNYLKSQYGDIAKLNAEWGANYTSWDEVKPMTLKEARACGKPAPWMDLRLAVSAMWTDSIRFAIDAVRKGDPGARVGAEGMHDAGGGGANGENSFNGFDFGQVVPEGNMWGCYFQMYPDIEFLRSFAVPGTVLFTFTNPFEDYPGGYFTDYYHAEKTDRFVPWFDLFNGMNGTTYWDSRDVAWWGFYSRDLRIAPWGENIARTIQEIKSGIGKLLLKSKRQNNGIAIYYSPASFHVETFLDGRERKESPRAFCALLEDLGLQYDFISKEQMAAGKLANYKFLVLPYTRALSQEEAKVMRAFSAQGGTIFADGPAGIMNEHGTKVATNMLSGDGLTTASNIVWKYLTVRDTQTGAQYRQEVCEALKKAGIEARYKIIPKDQNEITGCEVVEWKDGSAIYLGVLQGREYIKRKAEDGPRPVSILLPAKSHVYAVREGKYLGYIDAIDTTIESAVAKLYALLPCRTKSLEIGNMEKAYTRGSTVAYKIGANMKPSVPAPHVYRVEIFQPDGRLYKEYSGNVYAPDGAGRGEFQLALNDAIGRWKMVVTDVATGVKVERKFKVSA